MIRITLYKKEGTLKGFKVQGHAGYAKRGKDIVCAAVSALVLSTVNAIEAFTDDEKRILVTEDDAVVIVKFKNTPGKDAMLLMSSMILGLEDISRQYGYVKISVKEEKTHV